MRGVRDLLRCGALEHGFLRVVCEHRRAEAGGVFLQEARAVPELRRTAHGRVGAASGGRGVRPAAGAAMGAEFPYPLRFLFAGKPDAISPVLGIVHRVIAGWLADQAGAAGYGAMRCGDLPDPALRQRAEPECSLPHAVARRRT